MLPIIYYDLAEKKEIATQITNGESTTVEQLLAWKRAVHPDTFRKFYLLDTVESFDPYGVEKSTRWEKMMTSVIFCLSGQIPSRQEVLRGRQLLQCLPNWFKRRYVDERFVTGFLAYLMIACKFHLNDKFQTDANSIRDVVEFILYVYDVCQLEMTNLLCVHRGHGKDQLIATLDVPKIERALNLERALLSNVSKLRSRKISWLQQELSEKVSSNMFPEMFIGYMERGEVSKLLMLIGGHFSQMSMLLGERCSSLIDLNLEGLDGLTGKVHIFLDKMFGTNWRGTDFTGTRFYKHPLVDIAINEALPAVKRFMPFYGSAFASGFVRTKSDYLKLNVAKLDIATMRCLNDPATTESLKAMVSRTIDWFYSNQLMHISAKAVYETAFFYIWGFEVSSNNDKVAFGIDRDHSEYQIHAWKLGFADGALVGSGIACPSLLYARRTSQEMPGGLLRDISFRQFWR